MTLKKMQKMKKGKVLIAIPENCMYLSKRALLIFGSEPDFCRGQDGTTSSSTTAHLRWVHLWKKDVYESTQLQELQVLHIYYLFYFNYSSQTIKWEAKLTPIQSEPFVQPTGPRVDIPSLAKEIFFLFFTYQSWNTLWSRVINMQQNAWGRSFRRGNQSQ